MDFLFNSLAFIADMAIFTWHISLAMVFVLVMWWAASKAIHSKFYGENSLFDEVKLISDTFTDQEGRNKGLYALGICIFASASLISIVWVLTTIINHIESI